MINNPSVFQRSNLLFRLQVSLSPEDWFFFQNDATSYSKLHMSSSNIRNKRLILQKCSSKYLWII